MDGSLLAVKLIIEIKFICSIIMQVIEMVNAMFFCNDDKRIVLIPIDNMVRMNTDNMRIYNNVKLIRMIPDRFNTYSLG